MLQMGRKVSQADYEKIRRNIVKKLYANKAFVKGHLLQERLMSGIPPHLGGFVDSALDELVKEEIVLLYGRTKHGNAYQLNVKKLKEIEGIIFG